MRAYERLLKYIKFDTASDEKSPTCPSTEKQLVLAKYLVDEMKAMGIDDAVVDKDGYVYGTIPATCEDKPVIGLIAHMDTVDEAPALPMNERIIWNWDGSDIPLNDDGDISGIRQFPELKRYIGKSLIVTDGKTILGADDKGGISEIMTLAEKLMNDKTIRHGKIRIGFTPDEEIGRGADKFNVEGFGADFAYTMDGGGVPEIEYENFNAASARIRIHGMSVHPGSAKNLMKNAVRIAAEFVSLMPEAETPEHTELREGFYHLSHIDGEIENARLAFIIRDHDRTKFEARKEYIKQVAALLNSKYGEGTVEITVADSYYNMLDVLADKMYVVDRARQAFAMASITAVDAPIRGGTDGARLSFMGLPCPNLPTGGGNYHSRFEYAVIEDMDKIVEVLENLVTL